MLFVCLDYPDIIEHVQVIKGKDRTELYESLDKYVSDVVNAKVQINITNGEIEVPRVMTTYKSDFGADNQAIIEFIYRYLDNPQIDFN